MPLDPLSEDAKLIAEKLGAILAVTAREDGAHPELENTCLDGQLRMTFGGYLPLNQLAVRLVQLFYGDRERSAEAAHLLAIRRDRPEDQPAAAMSPDHQ